MGGHWGGRNRRRVCGGGWGWGGRHGNRRWIGGAADEKRDAEQEQRKDVASPGDVHGPVDRCDDGVEFSLHLIRALGKGIHTGTPAHPLVHLDAMPGFSQDTVVDGPAPTPDGAPSIGVSKGCRSIERFVK